MITRFTVSGHSMLAPKGTDILCAAASAIVQTAMLALRAYGQEHMIRREGYIDVKLMPHLVVDERVQAVLQAMVLGLKDLQEGYPAEIIVSEVSGERW